MIDNWLCCSPICSVKCSNQFSALSERIYQHLSATPCDSHMRSKNLSNTLFCWKKYIDLYPLFVKGTMLWYSRKLISEAIPYSPSQFWLIRPLLQLLTIPTRESKSRDLLFEPRPRGMYLSICSRIMDNVCVQRLFKAWTDRPEDERKLPLLSLVTVAHVQNADMYVIYN